MKSLLRSAQDNLIARLQRGEPQAFAELIAEFGPSLHRLSRRYARSEADAEDLTQEIFIAVTQGIVTFRREAKLTTWIYRVALNHCLKHTARRSDDSLALEQITVAADSASGPEHSTLRADLRREVHCALHGLTDGHREVVILHELHGLTYAECAEVMGVPVGTVKSRLFHAFAKLRGTLRAYVTEEDSHARSESVPVAAPRAVTAAIGKGGAR